MKCEGEGEKEAHGQKPTLNLPSLFLFVESVKVKKNSAEHDGQGEKVVRSPYWFDAFCTAFKRERKTS